MYRICLSDSTSTDDSAPCLDPQKPELTNFLNPISMWFDGIIKAIYDTFYHGWQRIKGKAYFTVHMHGSHCYDIV